ncbi:MAG: DUF2090 domain-containing protein [Candidatus Parcubacteria bacterium]|nr:DUF2090 domain-containing protein [Candidatus Parcubacteria bacterium]
MLELGYNKNLFILPFDHRSSFFKLLNIVDRSPTNDEIDKIKELKGLIYDAFKKAVSENVPRESAAILVDEQFGGDILKDAFIQGFTTILTTEKSGQKEFTFEYGDSFSDHLQMHKPTFAKALIRYKPTDSAESKTKQQQKLKILSDYCHNNGYKFLLEVLIFESGEVQSEPMRQVIEELQKVSVEPDVWKMEGMDKESDYLEVMQQIRKGERKDVGLVVLGRGGNEQLVEGWIKASAKVNGVIGFAIGRTIFSNPLLEYQNGTKTKEQTIDAIKNKFVYFYNVFMNARKG